MCGGREEMGRREREREGRAKERKRRERERGRIFVEAHDENEERVRQS